MSDAPIWYGKYAPLSQAKMQEIYTLHFQDGMRFKEIAAKFRRDEETIAKYLRQVEVYHPWLDPIALDRAWWGDYEVLKRLSVYEVEAFVEMMVADPTHYNAMADKLWARFDAKVLDTLLQKCVRLRQRQAA